MTAAQDARLRDIYRDLLAFKTHPSPFVRAKAARFTDDEVAEAKKLIATVLENGDGFRAHKLIEAWHKDGEAGVVAHALQLNPTKTTVAEPF